MAEIACAVPFRFEGHIVEIMLVTSRKKGDWIFPKGNIDSGDSPAITAVKEAWEEAGVVGVPLEPSVAEYKLSPTDGGKQVEVFLLQVNDIGNEWPEKKVRKRMWFPLSEAGKHISKSSLLDLLPTIEESILSALCLP